MIGTAVVVPHPPLLVPELAGAAAGETAELRVAAASTDPATARGYGADLAAAAGERVGLHSSALFGVAYHVAVWHR